MGDQSKKTALHLGRSFQFGSSLAADLGFEPRLPDSESGVLPLDESAVQTTTLAVWSVALKGGNAQAGDTLPFDYAQGRLVQGGVTTGRGPVRSQQAATLPGNKGRTQPQIPPCGRDEGISDPTGEYWRS